MSGGVEASCGEARSFLPVRNEMGESPLWLAGRDRRGLARESGGSLVWVDVEGSAVFHWDPPSGSFGFVNVGEPVRALARRDPGGFVAVTAHALFFWDPDREARHAGVNATAGRKSPAAAPTGGKAAGPFGIVPGSFLDDPDLCYNDCAADGRGRLFVSTCSRSDPAAPVGSLLLLGKDGAIREIDAGLSLPGGMGTSPDGSTLFLTETLANRILAYDYDGGKGTASNRRTFAEVPRENGMPKGLAVDSQGFPWSAHWGGWRVTRYDPEGRVDRVVELPVSIVTSVGFGGDGLDELFITTGWHGLSDEEREAQPSAGDLFNAKAGVKGIENTGYEGGER